jgi:hypothetical protein
MNNTKESQKAVLIYLGGYTGRSEKDGKCKQ